MVYVLIMTVSTVAIVLASSQLAVHGSDAMSRRIEEARARHAFEGAVAEIIAERLKGSLAVPSTKNFTLNGVSTSASVTNNAANVAKSYRIDATMTVNGRSYRMAYIFGNRTKASPFFYAIWTNGSMAPGNSTNIQSGSVSIPNSGNIHANGANIQFGSNSTIRGDASARTTIAHHNMTITGTRLAYAPVQEFPDITRSDYQSTATVNYGSSTMNGYTFAAVPAGQPYPLVYRNGNLSISGTFSGKGVIYVTGTVTFTGSTAYANSNSHVAIIAEGDIDSQGVSTSLVGYIYTRGTFTASGGGSRILSRGSIVCGEYSLNNTWNSAINDRLVWNVPEEGYFLRLPGFWP
jgi:hypothetical protein